MLSFLSGCQESIHAPVACLRTEASCIALIHTSHNSGADNILSAEHKTTCISFRKSLLTISKQRIPFAHLGALNFWAAQLAVRMTTRSTWWWLQAYPPNINIYPQPYLEEDPPDFNYAPSAWIFAPGTSTVSGFCWIRHINWSHFSLSGGTWLEVLHGLLFNWEENSSQATQVAFFQMYRSMPLPG